MTDETDIRSDEADSGRMTEEKLDATIIATSGPADDPDVYLVEYPDGEQVYEPATATNIALFEDGLASQLQGYTDFGNVNDARVELDANIESQKCAITVDGNTVTIPKEYFEDVVHAFKTGSAGDQILDLYDTITEGQVRRDVVHQFLERFPADRVNVTPKGWVVDDTFIVTYEGTNHLVDVDPVDPYGDEVDDSKQAVYLDIDATETRTVAGPNGDSIEVDPLEQEFITQVEGLLYPGDYFGVELVDEIQQHKAEQAKIYDVIEDLTEQADVTGFTDSKTGIHHGSADHDFQKHDVSDLNVTDDVRDKLWSNPYDHAAVHEMLLRKQEFINNPDIDVFTDRDDDSDSWKWDKIEETSEKAPIPDDVRRKLDDMFK